eukprot:4502-Rhodomonas_salina.3
MTDDGDRLTESVTKVVLCIVAVQAELLGGWEDVLLSVWCSQTSDGYKMQICICGVDLRTNQFVVGTLWIPRVLGLPQWHFVSAPSPPFAKYRRCNLEIWVRLTETAAGLVS